MPFAYKDYYKILEISRQASSDEIRKAYRKLARKYHPDINPGNKLAEEKFKEINEAYAVLSNSEQKKQYDDLGSNWQHGQQFRVPPGYRKAEGSARGFTAEDLQFDGTGFSDFFETIFGRRGFEGTQETFFSHRGRDVEADISITLEEAYHGSQRTIKLQHRGTQETYRVKIPAGVSPGTQIRLTGQGEAGRGSASAGDLYLRVRFAPHPYLHLEGKDLIYELELAPWEAVLGTEVTLQVLGKKLKLKIPSGTQNEQQLRLRKQGFCFNKEPVGDLIVKIRVEVPESSSTEEKRLWTELAQKSSFNPRKN